MSISIGIPAYNAEPYLRETLESVLRQTLPDWEAIVVDDGSRDATAQIAQEFAAKDPRIRLVCQANSGVSTARNRAFAEMSPSSEYVIFLDADDLWEDSALEILAAVLEELPDVVAVRGRARSIDSKGEFLSNANLGWGIPTSKPTSDQSVVTRANVALITFAMLAAGTTIATPGMVLIRRSAFVAAGAWDPEFHTSEDLDLWFRLTLQGNIAHVQQMVLRYRRHESNATSNSRRMIRSDRAVRRKICALVRTLPERQREIRAGYRRFELQIAHHKLKSGVQLCARFRMLEGCRQFAYAGAHLLRGYRGLGVYRKDDIAASS